MTSKRVFLIMCGVVGLLTVLSIATVVLGNNLLEKKNNKLTELKLESEVLEQQKIAILQAQKDIEKYAELERIVKQIVPQEKDQARSVREIIQFAEETGMDIASITFPSSSLGQAAPAAPKPAEGDAAPQTPAAPAAPPVTQVKPVEGITGVYQLEINVQSVADTASFPRLIDFLKKLESNRRTSNVTTITITPNAGNRSLLSFTMTINVYLKP